MRGRRRKGAQSDRIGDRIGDRVTSCVCGRRMARLLSLPARRYLCASSVSPQKRIENWLSDLDGAIGKITMGKSGNQVANLFSDSGFWRDMVAFSWNIRTFEGVDDISDALVATAAHASPHSWQLCRASEPTSSADGCVEAWLSFTTVAGIGKAHLRLDASDRATTLLTTLQELHDHPFAVGRHRQLGAEHGVVPKRRCRSSHQPRCLHPLR